MTERDLLPELIIIHHSTYLRPSTPQEINKDHKERWSGITVEKDDYDDDVPEWLTFDALGAAQVYAGYHDLLTVDGVWHRIRPYHRQGAHCREGRMNFRAIGLCVDGNYEVSAMSMFLRDRLIERICWVKTLLGIEDCPVEGHLKYKLLTKCPGKFLVMELPGIRREVIERLP